MKNIFIKTILAVSITCLIAILACEPNKNEAPEVTFTAKGLPRFPDTISNFYADSVRQYTKDALVFKVEGKADGLVLFLGDSVSKFIDHRLELYPKSKGILLITNEEGVATYTYTYKNFSKNIKDTSVTAILIATNFLNVEDDTEQVMKRIVINSIIKP